MKTTWEHQKRVGVFVAIGLLTICLSIFFIGGNEIFKSKSEFKAHFAQIQGITSGSVVSLSGIKVGNIKEVNFIPNQNSVEVTFSIDHQFANKITQGSKIEIRTQGALGDKYLFITPGPIEQSPLAKNSVIPNAPNTDILSVLSEKGDRAAAVFDILENLQKITQSLLLENRMAKIPAQTEQVLQQLSQTLAESHKLLKDIRGQDNTDSHSKISRIVDKVEKIVDKLDRGEGTLGALITDTTIHDQLKNLLGAQNTSHQTRSLLRTSIKHQENQAK
jgi:phospholipid/cholesterol/gamma-HCH transport system substrate-binding protein